MSVAIAEDIASNFTKIRTRKGRYIVMAMNEEGTEVNCEHFGERGADFAAFASHFTSDVPRLAVIDFEYEADGRQQSKIIYCRYTPDA